MCRLMNMEQWLPKSKTITRELRVIYSASYLSEWLSDHPLKDPESSLWIKLTGRNAMKAMIGVYVHLASEDVEEAILKMHGIKANHNNKDLEVNQYSRCLMVNPTTSSFCSRCGLPLTEEAIQEIEK